MFVAIKATSLNARASASKSKLVKVKRREDDTKYVAKTIAAIVIHYILCTWCVQRARPLFCAIFKPVRIIFTVLMGTIFLGDDFHLGSLISAVIIVVGFYSVI